MVVGMEGGELNGGTQINRKKWRLHFFIIQEGEERKERAAGLRGAGRRERRMMDGKTGGEGR